MKYTTYIKLIISIAIIAAGVWYFVIKDYNYRISFTSKQAPGIIYANLLQWNPDTQSVNVLSKTPFSGIVQELKFKDSVFEYRWVIKRQNDSVTKVSAYIKDRKHSFLQNLQVPFYKNAFVKRNVATVKKLGKELLDNTKYYKVSAVEEAEIPAMHCAYIELSSKLEEKGNTMMKNIYLITDYLKGNDIAITGNPFLEVSGWNLEEGTITFNFCFPVEERDNWPETGVVQFKKTKTGSALKTTFNGNYKISDSAWYTLIDYAQTNNISITGLPVEVYLNDPHGGGDELQWQAEVYMPLKY